MTLKTVLDSGILLLMFTPAGAEISVPAPKVVQLK